MIDKQRILLVEDDISLSEWIKEYLERHDYEVYVEHRGDRVVDCVEKIQPALLILDVMLPMMNGFDICRELRPSNMIPILMLTARDDEIDQVVGLELGADDYMIKPVKPRVLLARIQALLRRYKKAANGAKAYTFGDLLIDLSGRKVSYQQHPIHLSDAEFDLLCLLASRSGEILSRDYILQTIHGRDYDGLDRSIDGQISLLRRKFDQAIGEGERIKTVRGKGYMFVTDNW